MESSICYSGGQSAGAIGWRHSAVYLTREYGIETQVDWNGDLEQLTGLLNPKQLHQ